MKKNIKKDNIKKDSENNLILSGPLNYIKLLNNKTNQSIWLFMDFHKDLLHQQKCEDYDAKDFYKFIQKKLSESDELIDFFLEINPTDINIDLNTHQNGIYLEETRKIFRKIYLQNENGQNKNVEDKQNIRLHYIDIRDYAFVYDFYKNIDSIFSILKASGLENIDAVINKILSIKQTLEFINKIIKMIRSGKTIIDDKKFKIDYVNLKIESETSEKINYSFYDVLNTGFYQLLTTILEKYNDKNNREKINNYFDINYLKNSENLIKYLDNFVQKLNKISNRIDSQNTNQEINIDEIVLSDELKDKRVYYGINKYEYENDYNEIFSTIEKIEVILAKLGCVFMDCFFLRRLIEKEYISKSIVYTGAYHSAVYTWFLVKYYDYVIDDYQYINTELLGKNESVDELKNIIDKSNDFGDLFKYLIPKKFNQCVRIRKKI
jgi:hypothetical protein